jgi:hypothetical protein
MQGHADWQWYFPKHADHFCQSAVVGLDFSQLDELGHTYWTGKMFAQIPGGDTLRVKNMPTSQPPHVLVILHLLQAYCTVEGVSENLPGFLGIQGCS